jgi:hypothetical protein
LGVDDSTLGSSEEITETIVHICLPRNLVAAKARLASGRRLFGQVRALAWSSSGSSLFWVASAPPAFKEARMNNVVLNYS